MEKERFPERIIPDMDPHPRSTETAGFNLICAFSENARNGFYSIVTQNDDTVYIYPTVFGRELSVQEIHFFWKDAATMADFFPEWVRQFIAYSYAMKTNPLPSLRNRFPEYNFKYAEEGIANLDAPLPAPGATILVFRDGGMAAMMDEDIIASDEMTNKTLNSAENLKLAETFIYQHLKLML